MVVVTNGCQDKGGNWKTLHLGRIYSKWPKIPNLDQTNKRDMKPHAPQIQNPHAVPTSDSTTTRAGHGS